MISANTSCLRKPDIFFVYFSLTTLYVLLYLNIENGREKERFSYMYIYAQAQ